MPYRIKQKAFAAAAIGGPNGLKKIQKELLAELLDEEFDDLCDGRQHVVIMNANKPEQINDAPQTFNVGVVLDYTLARPGDAKEGDIVHRDALKGDEITSESGQPIEGDIAHWGAYVFGRHGIHWQRSE